MILHLLRHAKTEKFATSGKDFDRNLAEKGLSQIQYLIDYFANEKLETFSLFVSAANRTVQTATLVFPNSQPQVYPELYLASSKQLLMFVNSLETKEDIFLIGHNEGISEFASLLTGESVHLQTSGYVAIEFSCENSAEMSSQTGRIIKAYRPEILS